jgi:hypothetical protein
MPLTSLPLAHLLLGFARLSAAEQRAFLTQLNQFMLASPHQRRSQMHEWEHAECASLEPLVAGAGKAT